MDDHNKNFGFLMGDDGVWHAAPAYDFTFSVDPSAPGYMNRHCMTIGNKNSDIGRGDLLELAGRYNIKGADAIIEKPSASFPTTTGMRNGQASADIGAAG